MAKFQRVLEGGKIYKFENKKMDLSTTIEVLAIPSNNQIYIIKVLECNREEYNWGTWINTGCAYLTDPEFIMTEMNYNNTTEEIVTDRIVRDEFIITGMMEFDQLFNHSVDRKELEEEYRQFKLKDKVK